LKAKVRTDIFDPPKPPPQDYFVPNFGQDHDVQTTLSNAKHAEKRLGHKFVGAKPADPPPRDYFVPDFGQDHDVKNTRASIK